MSQYKYEEEVRLVKYMLKNVAFPNLRKKEYRCLLGVSEEKCDDLCEADHVFLTNPSETDAMAHNHLLLDWSGDACEIEKVLEDAGLVLQSHLDEEGWYQAVVLVEKTARRACELAKAVNKCPALMEVYQG